jgi:hypothetical protein
MNYSRETPQDVGKWVGSGWFLAAVGNRVTFESEPNPETLIDNQRARME